MTNNLNYLNTLEKTYIAGFKEINKKISFLFRRFEYEEDYYGKSDLVYKFTNLHYLNLYFFLLAFKDEIIICDCIKNYMSCNGIKFEDFNYIYNLTRSEQKEGIASLEIDKTFQVDAEERLNYGNLELKEILETINQKRIILLSGSIDQTLDIDNKALDLENNTTIKL